jgi:hypothetical protein
MLPLSPRLTSEEKYANSTNFSFLIRCSVGKCIFFFALLSAASSALENDNSLDSLLLLLKLDISHHGECGRRKSTVGS